MVTDLARTPLYELHVASKARMVDFAGWSMPVYYSSIVDEHLATRRSLGLFDISHMGRLRFEGPASASFLDRILTRRVLGVEPGLIRYSLVTNETGGILDDVLVYHLTSTQGSSYYYLVVNAGNREKIVRWIRQQRQATERFDFRDESPDTAMIAVQGPSAMTAVASLLSINPNNLAYYSGSEARILGQAGICSRTGYTGEDGVELIVPSAAAASVWAELSRVATSLGGCPVGLGARDTLRLEAAMPLYGHELTELINPFQAGLSFAVNLKDRDFIGRAALLKLRELPDQLVRVGLEMEGKRIPREHFSVLSPGLSVGGAGQSNVIGEVTSGTFSPALERPIAMAYVRPMFSAPGTELAVDIRGRAEPARVVKLPFYSRARN